MSDYILRVSAGNGSIRGFFCNSKKIANMSYEFHNTTPVVSVAMGRCLTAASMMGVMLKNDSDLVTLKINGEGPMKGLIVTGNSKGHVKGYPYNNNVESHLTIFNNLDVGGAIGYGTMTIIKDMGLKKPYSGQIPLITGEIADDLTYYFAKSEQTPTSIALGVLIDKDYSVKQSGGFIVQLMPDSDESFVDKLEAKIQSLPPLTKLLEDGNRPEDIANILLGDFGLEILQRYDIKYDCNCSYEKVEKALISVGKNELIDILETDKIANIKCHFCNKSYDFSENDLIALISKL